ncbi:hypothetical protein J3R82DRAFT_7940 [Butyriboletus roseoflavus]|nr:hypothetical protein J3R82DRAFT_7940 [Butyriboletus roseoflavus]
MHTKSLEDLSSTLARTGIEVVYPSGDGDLGAPSDDERKGGRNLRTVRISDTVEVSPAPVPRRRKLTKSRPGLARGPAPGTGTALETISETKIPDADSGTSLVVITLEIKGIGRSQQSAGVGEKSGEDGRPSTSTRGVVRPNVTPAPTPVPVTPTPNGSVHVESPSKLKPSTLTKKPSPVTPLSTSTPSTTPRKTRRYTFSFFPSPNFHRPKREKSNTNPGVDQHANTKGKPEENSAKAVESGTDSTSTSICTITHGSQSTLMSASPIPYNVAPLASSGSSSAVPMLRRLNAQAMATAGVPALSEWDGGGDSTPSLITNGSTVTLSSNPRTLPSFVRLPGGEPFAPQPSGLKAFFTDTSEENDAEGSHGGEEWVRTAMVCAHWRQDPRMMVPKTSEEEDRAPLRTRSSSGLSMGVGLSPSPRPGTPSSMLTTATETSGSYVSFSTVPTSTTSSSSTSRSPSPSLMMADKRDRVVSMSMPLGGGFGGGDGNGDVYTCALCGQLVPRSISPPPSQFATREPDHPMFTVPLVTLPMSAMSAVGAYPRRDAGMGNDVRYIGRRKSERHLSVPVPATVSISPRSSHMGARVNGGYVPSPTAAVPMTTAKPSVSPLPLPTKVRKRRRPQTAPAGTRDAASKFIEDMRSADGHVGVGVGVGAGVGGDRAGKPKSGSVGRESKIKTALKGLLRWNN